MKDSSDLYISFLAGVSILHNSQFVSLRGADTWRRSQDLVTLVTLSPLCLVTELVLAPQHDNG